MSIQIPPLFLRFTLGLMASFAAAVSSHAAKPPTYESTIPRNMYEKNRGDWMRAANWELKQVPTGQQWAVISSNTTVTLSQKAPQVHCLNIGGTTLSKLLLEKDAELGLSILRIRAHIKNTVSELEMKGGRLDITPNTDRNSAGGIFIGNSGSVSSAGILRIGGESRFAGRGITVGCEIPHQGVGTLSLVGSKVGFTTQKDHVGARIIVFAGSTLEFVFDEEGVSTIDYDRTGVFLHSGALVRIDATAYRGKKTSFQLIASKSVVDEGARYEYVGFDKDAAPKVERTNTGLHLKIGRAR